MGSGGRRGRVPPGLPKERRPKVHFPRKAPEGRPHPRRRHRRGRAPSGSLPSLRDNSPRQTGQPASHLRPICRAGWRARLPWICRSRLLRKASGRRNGQIRGTGRFPAVRRPPGRRAELSWLLHTWSPPRAYTLTGSIRARKVRSSSTPGAPRFAPTRWRSMRSRFRLWSAPASSSRSLTVARRRYMSAVSLMSRGDQRRSAMAAVRGQIRESMVSLVVHSDHIVASPPRM